MKRIILAAGAATIAMIMATPASAQATRTWVSGVGDDVNPCSRTAPCKTFAGAISKTATGGEINCLDPAGYGSITITKSITIDCNWTHGSILAANVNGIIVNDSLSPTPGTAVVVLRGLQINGANTTTGNGIRIIQGAAVIIDDLTIENFRGTGSNGRGIVIEDNNSVRVSITNSRIYNSGAPGIHAIPTGGVTQLDISNTQVLRGTSNGIQIQANTTASIDNVVVSNHGSGAGIVAEQASANVTVSDSVLANNAFGVLSGNAGGTPSVRISGNVITGNTTSGLQIGAGANIISANNNIIRGNAGNETPSMIQGPT